MLNSILHASVNCSLLYVQPRCQFLPVKKPRGSSEVFVHTFVCSVLTRIQSISLSCGVMVRFCVCVCVCVIFLLVVAALFFCSRAVELVK